MAKNKTGKTKNPLQIRLEDVGLVSGASEILFAQGRVDEETGTGAFVVKNEGAVNDNGTIKELDITYWYRMPGNQAPPKPLSLFKIECNENGHIESLYVGGYEVSVENKDSVRSILQAIRDVQSKLSANKLPELAQIIAERDISRIVGSTIRVVGQKKEGGFDFKHFHLMEKKKQQQQKEAIGQDIKLPGDPVMLRALFGLSQNSANPFSTLQNAAYQKDGRLVISTHTANERSFENRVHVKIGEDGSLRIKASIIPEQDNEPGEEPAASYPKLVDVFTKSAKGKQIEQPERDLAFDLESPTLQNLTLINSNRLQKTMEDQMRTIGAINGMLRAMGEQQPPVPIKHMADFNLLSMAYAPQHVLDGIPAEKGDFSFRVTPLYGHSLTNVYGDFGGGLGITTLVTAGPDRTDADQQVVGLQDFAFEPTGDGSEVSGALANIKDWLPHLDFLAITHRHLDHCGALPYEDFSGKSILCTPQVHEFVKNSIRQVYGTKAKDIIKSINWEILEKNGRKTFSKDGGKSGITVLYAPNTVPHSTPGTAFYYAAFHTDEHGKKHIKGVYVNLGDVRDAKERSKDDDLTDGSLDNHNVNPYFFERGWREHLKAEHPDLEWSDIPTRPTMADWDMTSVRLPGKNPPMENVLENMKQSAKWFDGRAIVDVNLSSSDIMFEMGLHTASITRRDYMTFGKNKEDTQRVQNAFGYSELNRPWAKGHQNQIYMDAVLRRDLQQKIDEHGADDILSDFSGMMQEFHENYELEYEELETKKAKRERINGLRQWGYRSEESRRLLNYLEFRFAVDELKDEVWKSGTIEELNNLRKLDGLGRLGGFDVDLFEQTIEKHHELKSHLFFMMRRYYEDREMGQEADLATLKMTQALHERLASYVDNYTRFNKREEHAHNFDLAAHDMGGLVITRNTKTSAMMFERYPRNLYLSITGSQGNDVETEAQFMKILENRALLYGLDPSYRHTARPLDKKETVFWITQPTIPGNEKSKQRMLRKAVDEQGFVVLDSMGENFWLYNCHHMSPGRLQNIQDSLAERIDDGVKATLERTRKILKVDGCPMRYSGHGRREDLSAWMGRVRALHNSAQHINNPDAYEAMCQEARMLGQEATELFDDGVIIQLDNEAEDVVQVKGKIPRGVVIIRADHPDGQPYNMVIHKEYITVLDPEGIATHMEPLIAGLSGQETISQIFGLHAHAADEGRLVKTGGKTPSMRPAPSDMREVEKESEWFPRSPSSGPATPGTEGWDIADGVTLG